MAAKVLASVLVLTLGALAFVAYVRDDREVRRPNQVSRNPPAHERAPAVTDKRDDRPFPSLVYKIPQKAKVDEPLRNPPIPAVKLAGEEPAYTDEAHRARIEGFVLLELLIERDGRVSAARVLKPLPFGLEASAQRTALTWRYRPARDANGTVRSVQSVRIDFKMPADDQR